LGYPLFVYGTLRRGGSAARLLRGAEFLSEASISGAVIFRSGYPGLVPGDSQVAGELFQVHDALWLRLDEYEGPGYVRRLSEVQTGHKTVSAWVYWLS
jgi:gamma-glutamylcyclotransferase (GGCT)/AIG2-like uncharacterized protein YtfP